MSFLEGEEEEEEGGREEGVEWRVTL